MNDERLQILRMVQEGKVSPDEAVKLLDALEQPAKKGAAPKPRTVRISVIEGDRQRNISFPFGFVETLLRVPGLLQLQLQTDIGPIDRDRLLSAVTSGAVGKLFVVDEGASRLELWIDP